MTTPNQVEIRNGEGALFRTADVKNNSGRQLRAVGSGIRVASRLAGTHWATESEITRYCE